MTRRPLSPPLPRSPKPRPPSGIVPPPRPERPPPPRRREPPAPPHATHPSTVAQLLDAGDSTMLDVVDNLLNRGVVVNAEVVLALADVDLVYLRLSLLLCAADRIFGDRADRAGSRESARGRRRRRRRR